MNCASLKSNELYLFYAPKGGTVHFGNGRVWIEGKRGNAVNGTPDNIAENRESSMTEKTKETAAPSNPNDKGTSENRMKDLIKGHPSLVSVFGHLANEKPSFDTLINGPLAKEARKLLKNKGFEVDGEMDESSKREIGKNTMSLLSFLLTLIDEILINGVSADDLKELENARQFFQQERNIGKLLFENGFVMPLSEYEKLMTRHKYELSWNTLKKWFDTGKASEENQMSKNKETKDKTLNLESCTFASLFMKVPVERSIESSNQKPADSGQSRVHSVPRDLQELVVPGVTETQDPNYQALDRSHENTGNNSDQTAPVATDDLSEQFESFV